MEYTATLVTESKKPESVAKALNVDNIRMSGLEITTSVSGGRVETRMGANSMTTLLSTLDDVLKCQIMAEGLV
ncbi:MAG: KEOPS complex subunit Pcc1 [Candidatus Altiarchaeota archaeon]|nr:KEOPS complex subunit Pcc1 [Candidatus Altiarchaeota archaeon]